MYLDGLDDIDKKIISLLTENSRMSFVDIGKEVNLSRVAVKTRIDALEENGVIEKYTIIVNPQKINDSISAYLEIELEPIHFKEATALLKNSEIVTKIYHITGESRLHVHTIASGHDEMEQFMNGIAYQLPGLKRLRCDVIMSRVKDIIGLKL